MWLNSHRSPVLLFMGRGSREFVCGWDGNWPRTWPGQDKDMTRWGEGKGGSCGCPYLFKAAGYCFRCRKKRWIFMRLGCIISTYCPFIYSIIVLGSLGPDPYSEGHKSASPMICPQMRGVRLITTRWFGQFLMLYCNYRSHWVCFSLDIGIWELDLNSQSMPNHPARLYISI